MSSTLISETRLRLTPQKSAEWTLLVYAAGDNDLSGRIGDDVKELVAGSSNLINIAVHLDLLGQEHQVLNIANGRQTVARRGPNVNAGDPLVLQRFLSESREALGRSQYIVCLSNHGKGWLSFTDAELKKTVVATRGDAKFLIGFQYSFFTSTAETMFERYRATRTVAFTTSIGLDVTSHDFLSELEVRQAISRSLAAGERYAIIGCDACFMSMMEVMYDFHDLGELFIGSQEVEESTGWPYREMLETLAPGLRAEEVANRMIGAFRKQAASVPDATLSAIRLAHVPIVAEAMDGLGEALTPLLGTNLLQIARARAETNDFKLYEYIDLHHFAENVAIQLGGEKKVVKAAVGVMNAVNDAVVATSNDRPRTGAYGISMYLPDEPVNPDYDKLLFVKAAPKWSRFVKSYGEVRRTLKSN